jgi:ABC-2 type transport system permease protein/oleandomycin transport system permease protein
MTPHLLSDTAVLTRRNLTLYRRDPTLLAFFTVQPTLLVVLITYVFGGAIEKSVGGHYIDYFMPGVFVLAIGFGSANTAVGIAEDLGHGVIDRFRSLPIARAAVLAGRTASDTVRNALVVVLMVAVGSLVGFRFRAGFPAALGAIAMTLAIGVALCWISAYVGLVVSGAEAAQLAVLAIIIPLSFASSIFVPVASMPGWLQVIANLNPITHAVDAIRALALGGPTAGPVTRALLWIAGILLVAVPLASTRYRRVSAS